MKKYIGWGYHRYEIITWQDASTGRESLRFASRLSAISFLNKFRQDITSMRAMRETTYGNPLFSGIYRINDNHIIQSLADMIINGYISIVAPLKIEKPIQLPAVARTAPVAAPPRRATPPPPIKPATVSVDPGLIAQAETLKIAAESGTPLCEQ